MMVVFLFGCAGKNAGNVSPKENTAENSPEYTSEYISETATDSDGSVAGEKSTTEADIRSSALWNCPFTLDRQVICMYRGENWQIPVLYQDSDASAADGSGPASSIEWTSSDPDIVSVDREGNLFGEKEGHAVITGKNGVSEASLCVNVYSGNSSGSWWDMEMLVFPDQVRIYRNFDQSAYEYGDWSDYVSWHGCAACCTTTAVRAWYPEEEWTPEGIVSQLEPEANRAGWDKNYAKSLAKQMPLSLKGISRVLELKEIPHIYVDRFDKDTLEDDLKDYLKTGGPIIYEAGNGGYHMMMILGLTPQDEVLVSDSVGFSRVIRMPLSTVAGQMFSSKDEPKSSYFSGRKTSGGYIKVGVDE